MVAALSETPKPQLASNLASTLIPPPLLETEWMSVNDMSEWISAKSKHLSDLYSVVFSEIDTFGWY